MKAMHTRTKYLYVMILCLSVVVPFMISDYWLYVLTMACMYAILAASWDLLAGYLGRLSLAHAAFFGIGAYTSAILAYRYAVSPWLGLIIGCAVSMLIAAGIAWPCIRLRGYYLVIVTLGFGQIVNLFAERSIDLTGGLFGLSGYPPFPGIPHTILSYYYLILFLLIASVFLMYRLVNSRIGLIFKSIRDDELLSKSLGIDTDRYKILCFVISSAFASIAGTFFAHFILIVSPEITNIDTMVFILVSATFGGIDTLAGAITGAFLLSITTEYLRLFSEYLRLMFMGLMLIIFKVFFPGGVIEMIKSAGRYLNTYSTRGK